MGEREVAHEAALARLGGAQVGEDGPKQRGLIDEGGGAGGPRWRSATS